MIICDVCRKNQAQKDMLSDLPICYKQAYGVPHLCTDCDKWALGVAKQLVKQFKDKANARYFDLSVEPPKPISTWRNLFTWFKS